MTAAIATTNTRMVSDLGDRSVSSDDRNSPALNIVNNDQQLDSESLIRDVSYYDSDIDSEIEGLNTFKLFIQLPTEDLTSFTNLPSGTTVFDLKAKIELVSGIPGQIYILSYVDGVDLDEESRLILGKNIQNADTLRVQLLLSWNELFYSTWKNKLDEVYYNGGVQLLNHACFNVQDAPLLQRVIAERAFIALYLACHRGHVKLTQALLGIGADYTGRTSYGRTPLHAAACQGHLEIIELLIKHGSDVRDRDYEGKSALKIASEFNKTECSRQLWLRQWNLRAKQRADTSGFIRSPRLESTDISSVRSLRMSFRNTPRQAYFVYKKNEPQSQKVELNGKRYGHVTRSECTTVSEKLLHIVELNQSIPLPPCNSPRLLTSARGRLSRQGANSVDYTVRENSLTAKILELQWKRQTESQLSMLLPDAGDGSTCSGDGMCPKLPNVDQFDNVSEKRKVSLPNLTTASTSNSTVQRQESVHQTIGSMKYLDRDNTTELSRTLSDSDVVKQTDKDIHVKFVVNEHIPTGEVTQEGEFENDTNDGNDYHVITDTEGDSEEAEEDRLQQQNEEDTNNRDTMNQESDIDESDEEDENSESSDGGSEGGDDDEVQVAAVPRKTNPKPKVGLQRARSAPLPTFRRKLSGRPVSAATTRSLPTLLYKRAKTALPRAKTWNVWLNLKQQQQQQQQQQQSLEFQSERAELRKQRNLEAYQAWVAKKQEEARRKKHKNLATDDQCDYTTEQQEIDPYAFEKWLHEKDRTGQLGKHENTDEEFKVADTVHHIYGTITYEDWLKEKRRQQQNRETDTTKNERSGDRTLQETKKRLAQSAKSHEQWLADKQIQSKIDVGLEVDKQSESNARPKSLRGMNFNEWLAMKTEIERSVREAVSRDTRSKRRDNISAKIYREWCEKKAEERASKRILETQEQKNELERRKERRRQNLVYQSFSNWLTNKFKQDVQKERELIRQLQRSRQSKTKSR